MGLKTRINYILLQKYHHLNIDFWDFFNLCVILSIFHKLHTFRCVFSIKSLKTVISNHEYQIFISKLIIHLFGSFT